MIKEITETYYINKFGFKFLTKEEAVEDEKLRESCPFKIRVIGPNPNNAVESIEAIDDSKHPFTGQKDGKCRVFLLKDLISEYKRLVSVYGERIGLANHHCGMGMVSCETVLLQDNDGKFPDREKQLFNE